jgi:hypothetical protein
VKTHISENVRFLEHESEVLKANPLGDPHLPLSGVCAAGLRCLRICVTL